MSKRTVNIISAKEARAVKASNPHLKSNKYCGGRYQWHGKASAYHGVQVEKVPASVHCIWVERRQDSEGPYAQMMCLHDR